AERGGDGRAADAALAHHHDQAPVEELGHRLRVKGTGVVAGAVAKDIRRTRWKESCTRVRIGLP
ncbi:MAG TPA: hypothetical protein VI111_03075, partial [Thermoleophilaceae bacterium]